MIGETLTPNERQVLHGLVGHPGLTDTELSGLIGVNKYTLNKAKRRMEEQGYFTRFRAPTFDRIGAELLVTFYGRFPSIGKMPPGLPRVKGVEENMAEALYFITESNQGFGLAIFKNYTDLKRNMDFMEEMRLRENIDAQAGLVILPYALTTIFRNFDYAPLLGKSFGIGPQEGSIEFTDVHFGTSSPEAGTMELAPQHRHLYHSLVEHPEASDSQIARLSSSSRARVNRLRRKWEADGLLRPLVIPNLSKLGFEVFLFAHVRFKPDFDMSILLERSGAKEYLDNLVFVAVGKCEAVILGAFELFGQSKRAVSRLIDQLRDHEFFTQEPEVMMFSVPDMEVWWNHKYGNVTKNILEF